MSFESVTSGPIAPYIATSHWEGTMNGSFSGYSPTMETSGNSFSHSSSASSPYSHYGSRSEQSTPSPGQIPASPYYYPTPDPEPSKPSLAPKSRRKKDEDLTPQQLKRRIQNRVSQQAVRRRRNSPARILETQLQEFDREHVNLMHVYNNNIEACIQTLTAEIQTLRELQGLLQQGTAVPAKFDAILASEMFSAPGVGGSVCGVDQSAAYQNHEFDSNLMAAQY